MGAGLPASSTTTSDSEVVVDHRRNLLAVANACFEFGLPSAEAEDAYVVRFVRCPKNCPKET